MKILQNSKFTGPAIFLLLILNSILLVMLLVNPSGPKPPFPPPPLGQGGPRDFLVHELNLNAAQQTQYDTLIKHHRAAVEKIQNDIRLNRDSLVSQLGDATFDSARMNVIASRIGVDQAQLESVTFEHFKNVKAICTPEQQTKFDKVIKEALHMMAGPHGPPPKE